MQKTLEEEYNLLKTLNREELIKIIKTCNYQVQEYFYKYSEVAKEIIQDITERIYSNIDIGPIASELFFIEQLNPCSVVDFRIKINRLMINHASIKLSENVLKYYQKLLKTYSSQTGLFKDQEKVMKHNQIAYNLLVTEEDKTKIEALTKEEKTSYFIQKNKILISDIVIDSLFEDNFYNVLMNIKELLRFQKIKKTITEEEILFYEKILVFDTLKNEEKIKFLETYRFQNIKELFYDHIRTAKDASYNEINNELLNLKTIKEYKKKKLSFLTNTPIYDLKNQKYTILVRVLTQAYEEKRKQQNRSCYTLINEEKNTCFGSDRYIYKYKYGYTKINKNHILHIFEGDSFSVAAYDPLNKTGTNFINRIMSPKEIITEDTYINEIQILNEYDEKDQKYLEPKPDLVISYNHVKLSDIIESVRLQIPIVILKKQKQGHIFVHNASTYIYDTYDENVQKLKRIKHLQKK